MIKINHIDEIEQAAREFLAQHDGTRIFAFHGQMGAGKTTFIKALCKQLGVVQEVTSPTFAIVNEYQSKQGIPIFHFDFYRVENQEEILDIGYEEYFFSESICFIEWPEKISGFLPENAGSFTIFADEDGTRTITKNVD